MTLQDIDAFLAVVSYGTYARAAEALFTTAPTIAYHIRQLESELGFAVVEKSGRYVSPTSAGRELYHKLRDVRLRLDCAVADARDVASQRKTVLHLGVMRLVPQDSLSQVLRDFYAAAPDYRVVLHEYLQKSYFDDFAQGRTDAICVFESNLDMLPEQVGYRRVWNARVGVAVACDSRLAGRASVGIEDLAGETIVVPDLGDGYDDPGIEPRIRGLIGSSAVLYSQNHEDAFHHVRIGRGVLVTPYATDYRDDTVAFVPLREFEPIGAGIAFREIDDARVRRFFESLGD